MSIEHVEQYRTLSTVLICATLNSDLVFLYFDKQELQKIVKVFQMQCEEITKKNPKPFPLLTIKLSAKVYPLVKYLKQKTKLKGNAGTQGFSYRR